MSLTIYFLRHGDKWEGKTPEEVNLEFHDEYVRWLADPGWNSPSGGEKGIDIARRSGAVLEEIEQTYHTGNVLVVSHKATIRIMLCSLLGIEVVATAIASSCQLLRSALLSLLKEVLCFMLWAIAITYLNPCVTCRVPETAIMECFLWIELLTDRANAETLKVLPGKSSPLGATVYPDGVNFCLFSQNAEAIELLLFDTAEAPRPAQTIKLDPSLNKTYYYWHVFVPRIKAGQIYAYRAYGQFAPEKGYRFDNTKVLLDPMHGQL